MRTYVYSIGGWKPLVTVTVSVFDSQVMPAYARKFRTRGAARKWARSQARLHSFYNRRLEGWPPPKGEEG